MVGGWGGRLWWWRGEETSFGVLVVISGFGKLCLAQEGESRLDNGDGKGKGLELVSPGAQVAEKEFQSP